MDDRPSSKQACNPVDKVQKILDELVATTESPQGRDRRREPHASLKSLSKP
jgi:hypothetical protein